MDIALLKQNIINVKERVKRAADGREVTIIAATKTVPAEVIALLPSLGIGIAGENRVQEFIGKYDILHSYESINREPRTAKHPHLSPLTSHLSPLNWHFIGRLQTNKVKYIIDKVALTHSVDRLSLAEELSRAARVKGIENLDILIEVNAGGEENKGGVAPGGLIDFALNVAKKHPNLTVRGMMPVLPIGAPEEMYLQMAALYGKLKRELPETDCLSMGMSGDYETAVRCGSNMVRLGAALFGARKA